MTVLDRYPSLTRAAVPERTVPRPEHPRAMAFCALPAEDWAVHRARSFARAQLMAWRTGDDLAESARIIVTEFVTNAVRHSGAADVSVRLAHAPPEVWIEVFDGGRWRPAPGPSVPGPSVPGMDLDADLAECGRGFPLVDALARRYGVHVTPHGTCAWALLVTPPAAHA
ncbi:ATP-binding protein [Streptomyces sp. 8N616]|uniref:ATP-binding protein n=1 Tax=Streptomyces sp. 8N616 TaxID=3457414 RepID=UPI003FCFC384